MVSCWFFIYWQESILAISFSNKASRYMCSGGSGQVVKIWDLQRKRCIKWLKGHTNTVTGVMYNCKDEHLASISLSGDLILHNLASGQRAAELKDPNQQVFLIFLNLNFLLGAWPCISVYGLIYYIWNCKTRCWEFLIILGLVVTFSWQLVMMGQYICGIQLDATLRYAICSLINYIPYCKILQFFT
jgi:WD40 repeat protein